jgi:biotin-dependent carboxylase-like uncharacterized protein
MAVILQSGIQTLIQDWNGRVGYMDIGIARSGFMDHYAGRLANLLAGNPLNTAALEITAGGVEIEFEEKAVVALTGADLGATLNDGKLEMNMAVRVKPKDVLKTGYLSNTTLGFRQYLTVSGGIITKDYLGSKATAVYGSFGGYQGRALKSGDSLSFGKSTLRARLNAGKRVKEAYLPPYSHQWIMRVLPGPDTSPDFFTEEGMDQFFETEYKVTEAADRSGIRLKGPKPVWNPQRMMAGGHPSNIVDHGYPGPGCINVSGDTLIIFPRECPTSGGYVCPFSIIYADQWMVGQIVPLKDTVKFCCVTPEEAIELRKQQNSIFTKASCLK